MTKPSLAKSSRSAAETSVPGGGGGAGAIRCASRTRAACSPHSLSRRLPISPLRSNDLVPVSDCAIHSGTSAARPICASIPARYPKLPMS